MIFMRFWDLFLLNKKLYEKMYNEIIENQLLKSHSFYGINLPRPHERLGVLSRHIGNGEVKFSEEEYKKLCTLIEELEKIMSKK